ncbi:MAG: hypothetical protein ACU0BB_02665 [Paracoccaceae bacterium]
MLYHPISPLIQRCARRLSAASAGISGLLLTGAVLIGGSALDAQEASTPAADAAEQHEVIDQPKLRFRELFIDETDGKFDVSNYLAKGGFIPVPIIITEPALGGGFGIMAQFVKIPTSKDEAITRTTLATARTRNGSHGYLFIRSGSLFQNNLDYRVILGAGEITLDTYPGDLGRPLKYTTDIDHAFIGSAFYALPDDRFTAGVLWDYRKTETRLDLGAIVPPPIVPDLDRTIITAGLGLGLHFDSRNNPITPTSGSNLYLNATRYDESFGGSRDYNSYQMGLYHFAHLSEDWKIGGSALVNRVDGNAPFNDFPSIVLRGVRSGRYQGETVLSAEVDVTRKLNDRWGIVGFAGYGVADAGSSGFFSDSGNVYSGGFGVRRLIARKQGLDVGLDVAIGPEDTIVYFQFGHAWARYMD